MIPYLKIYIFESQIFYVGKPINKCYLMIQYHILYAARYHTVPGSSTVASLFDFPTSFNQTPPRVYS